MTMHESLLNVGRPKTANKKDIYNSNKHEFNVLSTLFKPKKRAKSKTSNYSPILQGCMNTCSRRAKFKNLELYCIAESF